MMHLIGVINWGSELELDNLNTMVNLINKSIFSLLFTSTFFFNGCKEAELLGYDQVINPVWEYNYNVGLTRVIQPIIDEELVIYASASEKKNDLSANQKLIALDKENGKVEWEWEDHFSSSFQNFKAHSLKPIFNGRVALTIGGRNFCIDLITGETIWKNINENSTSNSELKSIGNILYRTDISVDDYHERIMEADFSTGKWKPVYEVNGGDSIRQGLQVPAFYFEPDGDTIMVFSNTLWDNTTNKIIPRLISYNKTQDSTYYDIQLDDDPDVYSAVDWFPEIYGDRIYLSVDDHMVCCDLYTGEIIWRSYMQANNLASNFLIIDGSIYIHVEGDGILWCFDAEDGSMIWRKQSKGNPSFLNYYEGKLIYVAGGKLWITDANDGATLATITAPSAYKNPDAFFSPDCTVDPETGNIFVTSWTTAYCYPPYEKE